MNDLQASSADRGFALFPGDYAKEPEEYPAEDPYESADDTDDYADPAYALSP